MKIKTYNLQKYYYWLFIVLAVFLLISMLINSFFSVPEADVYTYSYITRQYGIIDAQKYWYMNWSGRIIPTLILSFGEFFIQNVFYYELISCMLILAFYATIYSFLNKLFVFENKLEFFFILAIFSLTITQMLASISSAFYWLPASITYTVPVILGYWGLYFSFNKKKNFRIFGLFILFLFTLFNEITDLLMVALFLFLLITQFSNKTFRKQIFIAAIVVIFGSLILYIAPGNYARKNFHHSELTLVELFYYSNKALLKDIIAWVCDSPLILFSLLSIFIIEKRIDIKQHFKSLIFNNKLILFVFIYFALLTPYSVFYKLGGEYPPERVVNIISCIFIVIVVVIFSEWLNKSTIIKNIFPPNHSLKSYTCLVITILILYSFNNHSHNISSIITDATSGNSRLYYREYREQLRQISESKSDTVYVSKINTAAKSIIFEVLDNDTTKYNNSQYCQYFNKKVIIVR